MRAKINVLIVDDHLLFRRGLESLLRQSKIIENVFQASTIEEVKDKINHIIIDIIFMDIKMPGNDGITITKEVMKINDQIKIIALSMLDDKATVVRMFNAGAVGFLTKCTDSEEIFAAINEVLIGNKFISSELPPELTNEYLLTKREFIVENSFSFTKRELQVLKLASQGYSNNESAKILNISTKSIEAIKSRLFDKTGATNTAGLVKYTFENGLVNIL